MSNVLLDNETGEPIGLQLEESNMKVHDRFFLRGMEEGASLRMFQVVDSIPVYAVKRRKNFNEDGGKLFIDEIKDHIDCDIKKHRSLIFVQETKNLTPKNAAEGQDCDGHKYLVALADGTPIKLGAEYVILNIAYDRHAQQAMKIYADSAAGDPDKNKFAQETLLKIQTFRNST